MIQNKSFKWYVYKLNSFTENECNKILDYCGEKWNKSELVKEYEESGESVGEVRENIRNVEELKIDLKFVNDKVIKLFNIANQQIWKYKLELDEIETPKILKYTSNSFYSWHPDFGNGSESTRKLSMIIQLSNEDSYTGGELEFCLPQDGETDCPCAPKTKGTVIIFNPLLIHRIKSVTSGVRYSLLTWVHGDTFK